LVKYPSASPVTSQERKVKKGRKKGKEKVNAGHPKKILSKAVVGREQGSARLAH